MKKRAQILKKLKQQKKPLPCNKCKGLCCTAPAMTPLEFEKIKEKYGVPLGTIIIETENIAGTLKGKCITPIRQGGDCTYLVNGKCSVYDIRPKVCKDYGIIKDLPCQYLYPEKAKKKVEDMTAGVLRGIDPLLAEEYLEKKRHEK